MPAFYHDQMRALQDRWEGRAVPDRLESARRRDRLNEGDRGMLAAAEFFLLATASETSVDCSFKGGPPGFVRPVSDTVLEWPDYDGNRMHRSLGNIAATGRVGLLFLSFQGPRPDNGAARLRINWVAEIVEDPAAVERIPGALRLVRLRIEHVFPNCPRYIPRAEVTAPSPHVPDGVREPEPAVWKSADWMRDLFE